MLLLLCKPLPLLLLTIVLMISGGGFFKVSLGFQIPSAPAPSPSPNCGATSRRRRRHQRHRPRTDTYCCSLKSIHDYASRWRGDVVDKNKSRRISDDVGTSNTLLLSSLHCVDQEQEEEEGGSNNKLPIALELEELQERLALIEALQARNEAQVESFVDEQDQWESLEPEERELLESKEEVESRMEILAEQLVQLWMGQKSMEG